MKKTIIIISIIGALLIILDSANAGHVLLLWVFAGILPGTDIPVPPTTVMAVYAAVITVIVLRLTAWSKIQPLFMPHHTSSLTSKKRVAH